MEFIANVINFIVDKYRQSLSHLMQKLKKNQLFFDANTRICRKEYNEKLKKITYNTPHQ